MQIPIRLFKGLYTNVDPSDLSESYFPEYRNIRTRPGFIESRGLTVELEPSYTNPDWIIVAQEYVFLDIDKNKNTYDSVNKKLTVSYKQNLRKYLFSVVKLSNANIYHFFIEEYGNPASRVECWDAKINSLFRYESDLEEEPVIINENGILKVLMKQQTLWVGHMDRYYWIPGQTEPEKLGGSNWNQRFFFIEPLVYQKGEVPHFEYDILTGDAIVDEKEIDSIELANENGRYTEIGKDWLTRVYRVKGTDGEVIPIPTPDGMVHFFRTQLLQIWDLNNQNLTETHLLAHPVWLSDRFEMPQMQATGDNFLLRLHPQTPSTYSRLGLGGIYLFHTLPNNNVYRITGGGDRRVYPISYFLNSPLYTETVDNNELKIPAQNNNLEIVTTIVTESEDEYVVSYQQIETKPTNDYVVKFSFRDVFLYENFPRKIAYKVYARYGINKEETQRKDFEQFKVISLLTPYNRFKAFVLNTKTPNGIFLTQTIGKFFEPDNYHLIEAFEDYTMVGGIGYILYKGNVHYPAVGNGTILNNSFYDENVIPNIEGQFLTNVSNTLGVFSKEQELLTLIEVQPVEGNMLFFVKDEIGYNVKDQKDIIETADGTFLHLKEGIFLINERERVLLSLEINDIIRTKYPSGDIYYNSFNKELYYINDDGVYVYYFDMQSWSKIDFNFQGEIYSAIDDYEGNIYFIASTGKYKLVDTEATGYLKSQLYGAEALTFMKRINHLAFDYQGEVKYEEKERESELRKQIEIHRLLKKRIPKKLEEFEFEFKGKIYNLEVNFDIFPGNEK